MPALRLSQAPTGPSQTRQNHIRQQAMHIVNGRQGLERNGLTIATQTKRPLPFKPLRKVHGRPPASLTGRKVLAGQYGVVGADPRA